MDDLQWYQQVNYKDAKTFIKDNINTATNSFIAIGYYLKHIRDNQMYTEDGYTNVWDLAQSEFGISRSSASRFISICEKFSVDGDSPLLMKQYKDFSSSKLQEMLTLTDDQLEQVTIGTTVAEIREIKQPEKPMCDVAQEPEKVSTSKTEIAFPKVCKWDGKSNCVAVCDIGAECCGECTERESCNGCCGWVDERIPKAIEAEQPEIKPDKLSTQKSYTECPVYKFAGKCEGCACVRLGGCPYDRSEMPAADESVIKPAEPVQEPHDEKWFVKQYFDRHPDDLTKLMQICREHKAKGEAAKAFQQYRSPYGGYGSGNSEFWVSCNSFTGGIEFRTNGKSLHMKYGRLVEEALKLYNPADPKYDKPEPMTEPTETVNEQLESENDTSKNESECFIRNQINNSSDNNLRCSGGLSEKCDSCDKFDAEIQEHNGEPDEPDPVETVEADIVQTEEPEENNQDPTDPEEYTMSDVEREIRTLTDNLKAMRDENVVSPIRYKTVMKLDAYNALRDKATKTEEKPKHPNLKGFMDDPYCPDCGEGLIYKCDCLKCGCKIDWEPVKGLFECEEEQLRKKISEKEIPELVQPGLPILKNNDQRKEWLEAYATWPIWIDLEQTGERYYRYDLTDRVAIVVKVSKHHGWNGWQETTKTVEYGAEQYYLLGVKCNYSVKSGSIFQEDPSRTFYECSSNKSALVDYLKEFRRKGA